MQHYTELELNLLDGRTAYWEYTWWDGEGYDPRAGDTLIENVWVGDELTGVKISELHPDDQAEVNLQIEKFLGKWVPND